MCFTLLVSTLKREKIIIQIDLNVIKHWIRARITEILGFEDDVLINFAISELENDPNNNPCPKKMTLFLTGMRMKEKGKF